MRSKQKLYTNIEAYEELKSAGVADGCEIILDWDDAQQTMSKWVNDIIETYVDSSNDLLAIDIRQTINNIQSVILPLLYYKLLTD